MTDKYDNFQDQSFEYDYPIDFKCHPLSYMVGDQLTTYEMNYKDTACFTFQIDNDYWDAEILIKVYNFRYEELYSTTMEPNNSGKVFLKIDADTSKKIFKKGIYYCGVQAITYKPILGVEPQVDTCTTLLPPEQCSILVK